ncbi:hypothetical protein V1525DRAFT_409735 [Lipomyces kononenkoae]|uniref:Uncharacterized protein n=1 Tax=Lipomyces kononenkoae TaxID=34357 RepID=A0ACC3SV44_LIPKO
MVESESHAINGNANGVEKKQKFSKNQLKRQRAKEKKLQNSRESSVMTDASSTYVSEAESVAQYDDVEQGNEDFEAKPEPDIEINLDDPAFAAYKSVIEKFRVGDEDEIPEDNFKAEIYYSDEDDNIQDEEQEAAAMEHVMSKKKLRKLNKISIAQLKAMAPRPELVEWYDADATDPLLLVQIKSTKNVVPVPSHWSNKREYLASKRGIEKPPFELPDFIKHTGIMDMRDSTKADESTLKQKTRERVQPKMGRLDIDYQKLHDAFFKFQSKPKLTMFGEIYYEGKEFETNIQDRRPGVLSDEIKGALNIPPGAPPPWLLNMQRFGPPPSYPGLKIPGLNAPIPPGAQWGYHPGGYGKPPVDEATNRPLYGDVFGVLEQTAGGDGNLVENIDHSLWGELQPEEEEEEEEEEENDQGERERIEEFEGIEEEDRPTISGYETPSGMASAVPSGIDTPDYIQLKKQRMTY